MAPRTPRPQGSEGPRPVLGALLALGGLALAIWHLLVADDSAFIAAFGGAILCFGIAMAGFQVGSAPRTALSVVGFVLVAVGAAAGFAR